MAYERHIIIGNLGGDPITNTTKDGQNVANFNVAVNRKKNGKKVTMWYHLSAWGKNAELAAKYLRKGSRLMVEGSGLDINTYTDKSGQFQVTLELTADRLIFLDSAPENDNNGQRETEDVQF